MRENPMCHLSLSYPTTFIKNCCWWLRQLLFLGVGWQDCQSLPTRTLHQQWTSRWVERWLRPSSILSIACYLHGFCSSQLSAHPLRRPHDLLFILTQEQKLLTLMHRIFPALITQSFPLRICGWCGYIFSPPADCGFGVVVTHAQAGRL